MLSTETLESYRRMTPGERLRLTILLMQGLDKALLIGTSDQVNRKFELLRRENDHRASIFSRAQPDASAFRLISRRALAHGFRPRLRSTPDHRNQNMLTAIARTKAIK